MHSRIESTQPAGPSEATLVIGADLRVRSESAGWEGIGKGKLSGTRIQDVFPSGPVRSAVLDVLASGSPAEGILIPAGQGRFLCASVWPLAEGTEKPRQVLLRASELDGRLVIEENTGRIVEANDAAARIFGTRMEDLIGASVADLEPFRPVNEVSVWKRLARRTSLYLGKFTNPSNGRPAARMEGVLLVPDA